MIWDDLIAWVVISSPLNQEGDAAERDRWRSHPGRTVLMMLVGIVLLAGVGGLVWVLG